MHRLRKWFTLTRWKRIFLALLISILSLSAIVFGSVFYLAPRVQPGADLAQRAQYVLRVNNEKSFANRTEKEDFAAQVAREIRARVDGLGTIGVTTSPEVNDDGIFVRVEYPGVNDAVKANAIQEVITSRPHLMFTDYYGNPLFNRNGGFNQELSGDPTKALIAPEEMLWRQESYADVAVNGAEPVYDTKPKLKVAWATKEAKIAWTKASLYVARLPEDKRVIVTWIDIDKYIQLAKSNWPQAWKKAGGNPYLFSFVGEEPVDKNKKPNIFKRYQIDVKNHLISTIKVDPQRPLFGDIILEDESFSPERVQYLAQQINFGANNYSLTPIVTVFLPPANGPNGFFHASIAIGVILTLLVLFLIFNYGILGLISALSFGLFTFLVLTLFVVFGGVFSVLALAGLFLALILFTDICLLTFERLKRELYQGSTLDKALQSANKQSRKVIFDSKLLLLLIGVIFFYLGSLFSRGLSLNLILGTVLSLLVAFLVNRTLINLILRSGLVSEKTKLFGLRPTLDAGFSKLVDKANYSKFGRRFWLMTLVTLAICAVVFTVFAGLSLSFWGGWNLGLDFSRQDLIQIKGATGPIGSGDLVELKNTLARFGVSLGSVDYLISEHNSNLVDLVTIRGLDGVDLAGLREALSIDKFNLYFFETITANAFNYGTSFAIAVSVSLAVLFVYLLIRFKWTIALAFVLALGFDLIMLAALVALFRVPIDHYFLGALLVVFCLTVNEKAVLFDKVREKMQIHVGHLEQKQTVPLVSSVLKDTLKRSWLVLGFEILSLIILMAAVNAVPLNYSLTLLIGLLWCHGSTNLLALGLWSRLEIMRQKGISRRIRTKYWDVNQIEEQLFVGINNYNP